MNIVVSLVPTLLRPPPILAFDRISSEQLWADVETKEITAHAPLWMTVRCAYNGFHRLEVCLARHFHYVNSALWMLVYAGNRRVLSSDAVPLRVVGPLIGERLASGGWFGFEFDPIWSAERTFTLCFSAPGAATHDAVTLRALRAGAEDAATGAPAPVFRTVSLIPGTESLWSNFRRFRRGVLDPSDVTSHQPIMARFEMSRACDLGCVMCVRGLQPFRRERDGMPFLTFDAFKRIEELVGHLLWVSAFGLGEPFLNPDVLRILRRIRELNPFTRTFISSNGNRLQPEQIEEVFAEGLISEFQISLDGADRRTFEAIRPRASYEHVLRSLERLVHARDCQSGRRTRTKVEMLVMRPNATLVYPTIKQMFDLGIDQVLLASPEGSHCTGLRLVESDWDDVVGQLIRAYDETCGRGFVIDGPFLTEIDRWHLRSGRTGTLPEWGIGPCAIRTDLGPQRAIGCSIPWESFTLRADGRFGLCCNSSREMGDPMPDASLQPWQQGPAYRAVRQEMMERRYREDCKNCLSGGRMAPDVVTPETYTTACISVDDTSAVFNRMLSPSVGEVARELISENPGHVAHVRVLAGGAGKGAACKLEGVGHGGSFAQGEMIAIAVRGRIRANAVVVGDDGCWSAWLHDVDVPRDLDELSLFRAIDQAGDLRVERVEIVRDESVRVETPFAPGRQAFCSDLVGFIDDVECQNGVLSIRGWASDRRAPSVQPTVLVTIDGIAVAAVRPWLRRMDVARTQSMAANVCGFRIEWPMTLTSDDRPRQVAAVVVSRDGVRYNELPWPARKRMLNSIEDPSGRRGTAFVIEESRGWLVAWTRIATARTSSLFRRWSGIHRIIAYRHYGYAAISADPADGRMVVRGWVDGAGGASRCVKVELFLPDGSVLRTSTGVWRGGRVEENGAYAGFCAVLPPGACEGPRRVQAMDEGGRRWPLRITTDPRFFQRPRQVV